MNKKSAITTAKIKKINKLLFEHYGIPSRQKRLPDPITTLIATILSQNTNDKNSYKAFNNLKAKYPDWEKVAELPSNKLEKVIKVAGLGKQKSFAIKNFLTTVKKENGKISLNHFSKLSGEEILNELTSFKGIGIKTAACVLLFSLNRNVCPVDTHVHRTLNRIGIVKTKTPDKTFEQLNNILPKGIAHQLHTNLIKLGREICKPLKPNCSDCPLIKSCSFKFKNFNSRSVVTSNNFMLLDEIK
jgi:endonuclease-3